MKEKIKKEISNKLPKSLTEDEERQLWSKGYKTAVIMFEKEEGVFLIKFDEKSIDIFFEKIKKIDKYSGYDKLKTHFSNFTSLLNDQILFGATLEERDLPSMNDALDVLKKAPFLERTSGYLASNITHNHLPKIKKSIESLLK